LPERSFEIRSNKGGNAVSGEVISMTVDQLAKELHELKRRCEMPLPLIEMFDALLSLAPGLSAK
jgi:hypothetical protein